MPRASHRALAAVTVTPGSSSCAALVRLIRRDQPLDLVGDVATLGEQLRRIFGRLLILLEARHGDGVRLICAAKRTGVLLASKVPSVTRQRSGDSETDDNQIHSASRLFG